MVTILENQDDDVLAFRIIGKISKEEVDKVSDLLDTKLKLHKKIKLYAEIKELEGYESIDALFADLKLSLQHFNDVEKAAIITEEKWIHNLTHIADKIIGGEVRHFHVAQEPEALQWVSA